MRLPKTVLDWTLVAVVAVAVGFVALVAGLWAGHGRLNIGPIDIRLEASR